MKEFKGKVCLITGAASGFGREFAKEGAKRGMSLVLADIDKDGLAAAVAEVKALTSVVGVEADVSLYEEVQKVVKAAMDEFGRIDLLFNNAGVAFVGNVWDMPARDFQWMVDTNYLSVIYGMKEVIPIMIKQGTPCHIVNTSSIAGIITNPNMTAYHGTKHAVAAASEATFYDLQKAGANIKMSIFCPGFVQTDLHNSEKHRPARYKAPEDPYYQSETYKSNVEAMNKFVTGGTPVGSVAETVFAAIEEERFYILTHSAFDPWIKRRHENIEQKRNPDRKQLF